MLFGYAIPIVTKLQRQKLQVHFKRRPQPNLQGSLTLQANRHKKENNVSHPGRTSSKKSSVTASELDKSIDQILNL